MKNRPKQIWIGLIMIFLAILILSCTPGLQAAEPDRSFSDITATDPDLAYIKYLAGQDIIKGYPDGKFQPQTGLTRAQAAVVMVKASKINLDQNAPSPFKDLKKDHWARAYVAAAVKTGYISGYPDGTFKPDQPLSRAQGISLLLKLSKQPQTAVLPALKDISSQHWAAKAVAVGLASGMVGLSTDGQNYYPDGPFTRINMAHALGILLTEDPTLYASSLPGKLKAVQGKTTIIRSGSQTEEELKETSTVNPGDSIITAKGASAELSYPDGSSILIKEDSKISIKEAQGRKYIKTNGQEGIAIDWLNLDMKQGTMFTALATKHEGSESTPDGTEKKTGQINEKTIASLNGLQYIAAAAQGSNQEMPWYEASKTKKVKVKVDMPWGVAAVRGTFVLISVSPSGQASVSCLTGTAEVSNGGQTVPLGQNQSTQVTTENAPPPPPAAIPPAVVQVFEQVKTWIEETAKTMDQNQEQTAPPPPPALIAALQEVLAPVQQTQAPVQQQTQTTPTQSPNSAMSALQSINQALGSIGISTGNNTVTFQTVNNQNSNSNNAGTSPTPAVVENSLGQVVAVTSGNPLNYNGGIKINLGTMSIPAGATVKVENYIPSQLGELQTGGAVVSIQFANLTISQPVEITLPVKTGIDTSKAGIYYYNDSAAKWEYQTCRLENGVLKASVSHFSVYGVLLDTTAPTSLSLQAGIPTSSSVALNYSAQDSSGIATYELYRDSSLIYSGSAASYTDSNLIAGNTYSYQFKAIDVLGNASTLSEAVTVQVPELPTVQITGLADISTSNGHGWIDFQVTPADASVTYSYSPASGFGIPGSGSGSRPAARWWMVDNASQSVTVTVTAVKEGYTPASQSFTVNYVPPAAPPSNLCQITQVISPAGAVFNGANITAAVANNVTSLSVNLVVSPQATWKLYGDNDYVNEIANKQINLNEGPNYSYIEVTAEDGQNTARYTLVVTRTGAVTGNPLPTGMVGLTIGVGKVMAVGQNGKAYISNDAINWTAVNAGAGDMLQAAAYGDAKYVAAGFTGDNAGVIKYLNDGDTTWNNVSPAGAGTISSIVHADSGFVAVSEQTIYHSANGITWTSHATGVSNHGNLSSVIYGNGVFVAVGYDTPGDWTQQYPVACTSADGINWTKHSITSANHGQGWVGSPCEPGPDFSEVTFANGKFYALENILWSGGNLPRHIYSSVDGVTWASCFATQPTMEYLSSIAYGNNTLVAISGQGLYNSIDGGNIWNTWPAIPQNVADMVYYNNSFIGVGPDGGSIVAVKPGPPVTVSYDPDFQVFFLTGIAGSADTTFYSSKYKFTQGGASCTLSADYGAVNDATSLTVGTYYYKSDKQELYMRLSSDDFAAIDNLDGTSDNGIGLSIVLSTVQGWNSDGAEPINNLAIMPLSYAIVQGKINGTAEINVHLFDSQGVRIRDAIADDFECSFAPTGTSGSTYSFAHPPFYGLGWDGYYFINCLTGSGDYTFNTMKYQNQPLRFIVDGEYVDAASANISGGTNITGTVIDEMENYLAGVTVNAYCTNSSFIDLSAISTATTSADGGYTLLIPSDDSNYIIKFMGNEYSPEQPYYEAVNIVDNTLDVMMSPDTALPTGIAISDQDIINDDGLRLTTTEPLTPQSWLNIFNIIKDNTGSDAQSNPWVTGDRDGYEILLNWAGTEAALYYYGGTAAINSDFRIPGNMIIDMAGNTADHDIIINSSSADAGLGCGVTFTTEQTQEGYAGVKERTIINVISSTGVCENKRVYITGTAGAGGDETIEINLSDADLDFSIQVGTAEGETAADIIPNIISVLTNPDYPDFNDRYNASAGTAGPDDPNGFPEGTNYIDIIADGANADRGFTFAASYDGLSFEQRTIATGSDGIGSFTVKITDGVLFTSDQNNPDGVEVTVELDELTGPDVIAGKIAAALNAESRVNGDYIAQNSGSQGDSIVYLQATEARADRNIEVSFTGNTALGLEIQSPEVDMPAGEEGLAEVNTLTITSGAVANGNILVAINDGYLGQDGSGISKIIRVSSGDSSAAVATAIYNAFLNSIPGYALTNSSNGVIFTKTPCAEDRDFQVHMAEMVIGGVGAPENMNTTSISLEGFYGGNDMAFKVVTEQPCMVCYVLVADGAAAPDAEQVLSGLSADNNPALRSGIFKVTHLNYGDPNYYDGSVGIDGASAPQLGVCAPYDIYLLPISQNGAVPITPVKYESSTNGC